MNAKNVANIIILMILFFINFLTIFSFECELTFQPYCHTDCQTRFIFFLSYMIKNLMSFMIFLNVNLIRIGFV
jgi:hypothetical protein